MNDRDISDLARMLPVPDARDFHAGRQQTLKEHLMTEFRIAGAYGAAQVQPRLVLEPAARRGSGGLGRPPHRRWLVPLAAAVAVLAVVAGALAAASVHRAQRTPPLPPPTAPIQTSVPPYYVSLTSVRPMPLHEPQAWPVRDTAIVRATSTGAVIASIAPPKPYREFVDVSGAADDRYFVLAAQYSSRAKLPRSMQDSLTRRLGEKTYELVHHRFFLLRIDPTASNPAARATLTALPAAAVPGNDTLGPTALSPNGRLLAMVATHEARHSAYTYLRIYNLVTGRSRTWVGGGIGSEGGGPGPEYGYLSWRQNSRFLAVIVGAQPIQVRWLNVTARGPALWRDSTPLAVPPGHCWSFCTTDITPNGNTIYIDYGGTGAGRSRALWIKLARFDVQSGTMTRVNNLTIVDPSGHYTGYASGMVDGVLWTSYDGSKVIVAGVRPGARNAGIYSGGHYTPIPWPANTEYAAW
jgi:hypothetical protein